MKILLFTTHLNIGGISSYVVSLAKTLKARGEDVFVASSGGILLSELSHSGISHIRVNIRTKSELSVKVWHTVSELSRLIMKLEIDVVHAHTRVTQVAGFFATRLCKAGFVTTCHGFYRRNIGRIVFPAWGDRVIAISDAVREQLIYDYKVDKDKISLVYNGIDVKKFLRDFSEEEKNRLRYKYGIRKGYSVIGTIARFTPDKGHEILLYALRGILKQKPDVQLVLVGDGEERKKIVDLTQRLNLSENVIFVKSQISTVNILSVLDVFMFTPQRKEGLGIALLEALAAGKPVVASRVGGITSVVEDGVNGFLVEPSRPELVVEPTLRLLRDSKLYKNMSQAGREMVIEKFSIDGMADKILGIYKEVAESYVRLRKVA